MEIYESKSVKRWEDYDTIKCPDGSIIDMRKLLDDQASAMAACNHIAPEFGGLINKLHFKYTFQVSTQATDGFSIYVNPQFTAQELDTMTKKVAVMLHEVMHCLLQHLRRGKGHNPMRSNIAADYEVNSTLTEMGLIPKKIWEEIHGLYDSKYKDMGYEAIYEAIGSQKFKDDMGNKKGSQQAQQNQNAPGREGRDDPDAPGKNQGRVRPEDYTGSGGGAGGSGQSGSSSPQEGRDDPDAPGKNQGRVRPEDCTGSASNDLDKIPAAPGGMIDKSDGDKMSESEGYDKDSGSEEGKDKEWAADAQKAANAIQKNPGRGQGWGMFAKKINGLNRVTTNWKKALANVVGRSLSEEDKRQAYTNKNVLVGQNRVARTDKDKYNAMSDIIALVDTSGSMSDNYKAACLRQVYQVANQKKATRIVVTPFDDGPRDVLVYDSVNKLYSDLKSGKASLKGGGGTDVRPCFNMLKTDKRFRGQCFELIMIFTDGALAQVKRDPKICQHLCWVIADDPGWDLQYKEKNTYRITMDSRDFKD